MHKNTLIELTKDPIAIDPLLPNLVDRHSGGVALFVGRVRDEEGRKDTTLCYESYLPLARKEMTRLAIVAKQKFHTRRIVMVHRVGPLDTGETAVIVGVAAGHRKEAFAACRFLIDRIKKEVPIWKTVERNSRRHGIRRTSGR